MNTYSVYIMFELQARLTGNEFSAVKSEFLQLLEQNKPDEALEFIKSIVECRL